MLGDDRHKVCLKFEDAFVITCVANVMGIKVLYVQQDLRYEISSVSNVLTLNTVGLATPI
jgi:hypothetical protein